MKTYGQQDYRKRLDGAEMGFVPELTAAGLTLGLRVYQPTHMIMIPKVYETIQKKSRRRSQSGRFRCGQHFSSAA